MALKTRVSLRTSFCPVFSLSCRGLFLNYTQRAQQSGCQRYLFSAPGLPGTGNSPGASFLMREEKCQNGDQP